MIPKLLVTGTMRTGGSLLINVLSAHSKILILNERVYFFRFIYNRYNPLNEENLDLMLNDQRLRLKYRKEIDLDVSFLKKEIIKKGINYRNIYLVMMDYFKNKAGKEIWGEFSAMSWREIPLFLKLFDEGKIIHTYRDPRGVCASWKKLSSIPNNAYLNCIFNWIDSTNHVIYYRRILNQDSYYSNKYEDVMSDPKKYITKLTDFIGVEAESILFEPDKWAGSFDPKLVAVPRSAHDGKGIVGYSTKRVSNWKKNLEDWEICLIEYLCEKNMKKLGYDLEYENIDKKNPLLKKGISEIEKNQFVYKNYKKFIEDGEGTNKYPTDPTDPRSWGQKGDISKWFVESEKGKEYYQELAISTKKIKEKYM
tara:strand:- start:882 stop:1979 length:1098 start_codon:yes stop_codon:yes gene_type:complete